MTKLTYEDVSNILSISERKKELMKLIKELPTDRQLAKMYGVNPTTIMKVKQRKLHRRLSVNIMAKYARVKL